jgi:AraC-like DNA-binding protein
MSRVPPPALREQVHLRRAPHLQHAEVLQATYVAQVFGRHTHEEFAVGVVDRGVHVSEWGGATHAAGPGAVVVNNPGDVHTGRARDGAGWSYRMLYPPAALLEDVAAQLADRPRGLPAFAAPVLHDPAAADALGRLVTALLAGAEPLETHTLFLAACTHLLRRHTVERPLVRPVRAAPAHVRRAREYLEAHAGEAVALADLARVAGLHPLYLVRAFRAAVGLPPHAYLTQTRVRWAKRLLGAGEPPAAVAARVGFVDQSHLTRHFKRLVGVPPGQYARAVRADTHRRAARD